jgi:hypothetical protein
VTCRARNVSGIPFSCKQYTFYFLHVKIIAVKLYILRFVFLFMRMRESTFKIIVQCWNVNIWKKYCSFKLAIPMFYLIILIHFIPAHIMSHFACCWSTINILTLYSHPICYSIHSDFNIALEVSQEPFCLVVWMSELVSAKYHMSS